MSFTLKPAIGENFFDREEIVEEMVKTLANKRVEMGFALIGPRRMGKTSILKEVARRLGEEKEVIPIYVSVWELVENTIRELSQEFTTAIFDAFKPRFAAKHKLKELLRVPAKKVYELLKTLDIRIRVMDEIEVELGRRERKVDASSLIGNVFGLVENLSEDFGVRSVLMIDEFPSIADLKNGGKVGEGIIRKIRTINEELKSTVLCISGSVRKTMEMTLLLPSSPFYRQFIVRNIGPLDKVSIMRLLRKNLGRSISERALDELYRLTHGIPFYVQFIGRELEKRAALPIDEVRINEAFYEMLHEEGDIIFSQEFYSLNNKEKAILKVMSAHKQPKLGEIAHELNESSNVVGKYMEYLAYKGILHKQTKGRYEITDPVFKNWIKEKFR